MYTLRYDDDSGRLIGATRTADGTQFTRDGAGWPDVVAWAAAQAPPVELSDRAPPTDAERVARQRASAAALITDGAPDRVLLRAVLKLIHATFSEQAAYLARIRARLIPLLQDPGPPPSVRDWPALMAALEALIGRGDGDPPAPTPVNPTSP